MMCLPKIKIPFQISAAVFQRGEGSWAGRQCKGLRHTWIYTVLFSLGFSNKNGARLSPFIASTFLLRVLFLQRNIAEHLFKMFKNLKTWIAMNPFLYKHPQCPPNWSYQKLHSYEQVKNSQGRLLSLSYRNGPISRVRIAVSKQEKANIYFYSFLM